MELISIGGDLRYAHLIRLARLSGMSAGALGIKQAGIDGVPSAEWADVSRADCVVMPNPFGSCPVLPLTGEPFDLDLLMKYLRAGTVLMLFGPGKVPDSVRKRHRVVMLSEDETLTRALARQTAEGAIHMAAQRIAYELYGCPVLVVGYGRIAGALHKMLSGYGAHVTVAARREEAREKARELGAAAVDLNQMEGLLPGQRIVFSTPPERVLDAQRIALIHPETMLIDLSSPPYGVDLEAARERGLNAWREPALPGRYCPESAGAAMLGTVRQAMKGETVYDE